MAKNKKNIADFQKALLSKAQFITADVEPEKPAANEGIEPEVNVLPPVVPFDETELGQSIDMEILEKFKLLSAETGHQYEDLLRHALTHYLGLKGVRLRDALIAKENKDFPLKQL